MRVAIAVIFRDCQAIIKWQNFHQDTSDEAQRQLYGLEREIAVMNLLAASMSNLICFHSVRLGPKSGKKSIEIDLLLLTADGALTPIEVKGYKGNYDLAKDGKSFLRMDDARYPEGKPVSNPVNQLKRTIRLLQGHLEPFELYPAIVPILAFTENFAATEEVYKSFEAEIPAIKFLRPHHLPGYLEMATRLPFKENDPAYKMLNLLQTKFKQVPALFPPNFPKAPKPGPPPALDRPT